MGNQKVREKKKPTFFLAVLPILAMILLLGVGYAVMGLNPLIAAVKHCCKENP